MFESKDLMTSVLPGGGLRLFPDTCRISAGERPDCRSPSVKPGQGDGDRDPRKPPACEGSRPPAGDGEREKPPRRPARAAGLALLRRELRLRLASFD